jgi:acyl-CoA synthetase (AMP-forming)/AMP-acid ligase II
MRSAELTRQALLSRGDRPILYEMSGRWISAIALVDRVERLAGRLLGESKRPRTVGVWYRNSIEAVEAFLAVEWAGLTRITVDPNAQGAEAEATFLAGGADLVLADREHAAMLDGIATIHDRHEPFLGEPATPRKDVSSAQTLSLYPRSVVNGKLFAIPFSYGNWDAILMTNVDLYRHGRFGLWREEDEVFLACQQIMHATGLVGTFPFLMMARPQILVDHFSADTLMDVIEERSVTATMLVPQMLTRLTEAGLRKPNAAGSLRHVLYGGGPIVVEDVRRAVKRFGPVLSQVYGRMEGGWPLSVLDTADHAAIAAGDDQLATSCGRPIGAVEVKLRPNLAGGSGELLVSSEMTVKEYEGNDGYCSLGDLMEIDEKGYLFYRGRVDRMINTGYHVYPGEIEAVLSEVPGVAEALVRGEPSREWGETVVAYLVAEPGVEAAELIKTAEAALIGKLARYKIPRKFYVVDHLPSLQRHSV